MLRDEFIKALTEGLAALPNDERSRVVSYYTEMIDDRIEDGMTEEAAVAALGSPEALAAQAAAEYRPFRQGEKPSSNRTALYSPISSLSIHVRAMDVTVKQAPLTDAATAEIYLQGIREGEIYITHNDGVLRIEEQSHSRFNAFRFTSQQIEVIISDQIEPSLECRCSVGDIELSDLRLPWAEVHAASSDITCREIACEGDLSIEAASGDITLDDIQCQGALKAELKSGDIKLESVSAASMAVHTVSGDVELEDTHLPGSADIKSVNGDLSLHHLTFGPELTVQSVSGDAALECLSGGALTASTVSGDLRIEDSSFTLCGLSTMSGDIKLSDTDPGEGLTAMSRVGDISLDGVCAASMSLESSSGDIKGSIKDAHLCRFDVRSRVGDTHAPDTDGELIVRARSISGDISFSAD